MALACTIASIDTTNGQDDVCLELASHMKPRFPKTSSMASFIAYTCFLMLLPQAQACPVLSVLKWPQLASAPSWPMNLCYPRESSLPLRTKDRPLTKILLPNNLRTKPRIFLIQARWTILGLKRPIPRKLSCLVKTGWTGIRHDGSTAYQSGFYHIHHPCIDDLATRHSSRVSSNNNVGCTDASRHYGF